jgi:hypothetical protein
MKKFVTHYRDRQKIRPAWSRKCNNHSLSKIQPRKVSFEIVIASLKKGLLFPTTNPAASSFPILGIQRVRHLHPRNHLAERHKRFAIVRRRIVLQIDEHLCRPLVRDGKSKSDCAPLIRFACRIVRNEARAPQSCDLRLAANAKLRPTACDNAKKTRLVVITRASKIIESVRAMRRPIAMNFDDNVAFAGFEANLEKLGRAAIHLRSLRIQKQRGIRRCSSQLSAADGRHAQQCKSVAQSEVYRRGHRAILPVGITAVQLRQIYFPR